jgi:hypothetical protein
VESSRERAARRRLAAEAGPVTCQPLRHRLRAIVSAAPPFAAMGAGASAPLAPVAIGLMWRNAAIRAGGAIARTHIGSRLKEPMPKTAYFFTWTPRRSAAPRGQRDCSPACLPPARERGLQAHGHSVVTKPGRLHLTCAPFVPSPGSASGTAPLGRKRARGAAPIAGVMLRGTGVGDGTRGASSGEADGGGPATTSERQEAPAAKTPE